MTSKSFYALWRRLSRKNRGFLLAELTVGLAICSLAAALICSALQRCWRQDQLLREQIELQQAGAYMQGVLEKHFGYNALAVRITSDNKVSYDSLLRSKVYTVYPANNGLYLRTSTPSGDGVNPLFVEGLPVSGWQARRLDAKRLLLCFTLQGQQGRAKRTFKQVITCYNGEINEDG